MVLTVTGPVPLLIKLTFCRWLVVLRGCGLKVNAFVDRLAAVVLKNPEAVTVVCAPPYGSSYGYVVLVDNV
jgi:hypothetical protein